MKIQEHNGGRRQGGFTLIELLVVIAIIVVLAGLIIAAMPGVKKRVYDSSTMQLLTGLSTNCEQYFQNFDAYPGPMPAERTTNGALTGAQNMLLGLTYPVYVEGPYYTVSTATPPTVPIFKPSPPSTPPTPFANSTPNWASVPGTTVVNEVNPSDMSGPLDFSVSPPRSHLPYYSPTAKEMSAHLPDPQSNDWPKPGGVAGAIGAGGFAFPVILDRYPDAMPLLYYRRTSGAEGSKTISTDSSGRINTAVDTLVGDSSITFTSTTILPYYLADNIAYTGTKANPVTLVSSSGVSYPQFDPITNLPVFDEHDLAGYAANQKLTGGMTNVTVSARGGFVLISAGYDHIYGKNPKSLLNDDVYVVGGH